MSKDIVIEGFSITVGGKTLFDNADLRISHGQVGNCGNLPATCLQLASCPLPGTCLQLASCPLPGTCLELASCPLPGTCLELASCPLPGTCLQLAYFSRARCLWTQRRQARATHHVCMHPSSETLVDTCRS